MNMFKSYNKIWFESSCNSFPTFKTEWHKKCDQKAEVLQKCGLTSNPGYLHLERLKWIWTMTEKQFDVDNNKTADEQNR